MRVGLERRRGYRSRVDLLFVVEVEVNDIALGRLPSSVRARWWLVNDREYRFFLAASLRRGQRDTVSIHERKKDTYLTLEAFMYERGPKQ